MSVTEHDDRDHDATNDEPRPVRTVPSRASGLVLVAMSAALWWPAFTLGAWGTLFFDQLLTVWAASSAAFVVVAIQPRPFKHRIFRMVVLLIPSIWLTLSFVPTSGKLDLGGVVEVFGLIVMVLGIPFTMWTLVRIVWPDFGADASRLRIVISFLALALLVVISYELGVHQADFLNCSDFAISGNSNPPGCTR